MSLQSEIDAFITAEQFPTTSFILSDRRGDATIPMGVNVRFVNCDFDTLTFEGYNTFHVAGGKCENLIINDGCEFLVEDCTPMEIIYISGSRGTIKKTDRDVRIINTVTIENGSNIEFIDTKHEYESTILESVEDSTVKFLRCEATVPISGLLGKRCNVHLSGCHFEQKNNYVISVEDHSFVQITDSHVEGYFDCPALTVSNNSTAIITQGDGPVVNNAKKGLYSGVWVVRASIGSYVKVKDSVIAGSPGNWSDYGLWADQNSVIEATGDGGVVIEGGDFPAVRASNYSSVTVSNYNHILCATREAIYCDVGSKVRAFNLTTKIESEAVDAIYIREDSRVEIYDVPLVQAPAGDGVDMENNCDFIAVNVSDKIRGVASYGVIAAKSCNVKLDNVNICIGEGDDGVFLSDDCSLLAINGGRIIGKPDNGIQAETNSRVAVIDYDYIWGQAQDGLHMEDNCSATLLRIGNVLGDGPNGIFMSDNCTCQTRKCELIQGKAQDGVYMEDECRYVSVEDTLIQGLGRDGIHGENSCEATSTKGGSVIGVARDGIYMESGRLINVRRTANVIGTGRDGIHADHCSIDVYHVDSLHGDGDKCIFVDNCVGTIETVPDGFGASYGLYEVNSSDIRVFRSTIAGANPLSLFMTNSSRLFAKDVEFAIKDAKTTEHCETNLENVTIFGKFESEENCKHEWLRVRIMDRIDFTDCIYRWKEVTILGKHECVNCTGKAENVEVLADYNDVDSENHFSDYRLTGDINHISCTTKLKGSTITGMIGLTTSTLKGENTTVSDITDFTSSKVEYAASTVANIDGKSGSSYKQNATVSAQIQLNESGGKMEGGETGAISLTSSEFSVDAGEAAAVTLTSSSFYARASTVGAISATDSSIQMEATTTGALSSSGSSIIQRGGVAGAITGSDSSFEHHAGTAGTVAITTGAIEQHGGTLGTVSITNGGYLNQGGNAGAITVTNSGFSLQGGTVAAVTVANGGMIQQGGLAGSISLSSSAFTGKGGTCGSVSCGASAVELISMSSGAISGTHLPIPACIPGMVVRVGTDKLYEVFDQNVKRWFNKNLEERVTVDKKVNVEGDSFNRITGEYQVDAGSNISVVSGDSIDIQANGDIDIKADANINMDAGTDFDLATGNEIFLNSGLNMWFNAGQDVAVSSLFGSFYVDALLEIFLTSGLALTTSAATITELAPTWSWPGGGNVPPLPETPDPPDPPDAPDAPVDPTP